MRARPRHTGHRRLLMAAALVLCATVVPGIHATAARAALNYVATPITVDAGKPLTAVTCPAASECIASAGAQELSFDPLNLRHPVPHTLFSGRGLVIDGLWCATTASCVGIDSQGAMPFDPLRFKTHASARIEPVTGEGLVSVRCPSRTECVAIDGFGDAVSYNPASGGVLRRQIKVDGNERLTALACPSAAQCTALDDDGSQVTFQPQTGRRLSGFQIDTAVGLDAPSGGSDNELDAVSCPSAKLCAAVDTLGNLVTFDPRTQASMAAWDIIDTPIDPGSSLSAISCKQSGICVAVDRSGNAIGGSATSASWQLQAILGAKAFSAVACPTSSECVAVDSAGNAFRLEPTPY